jgi:molybdate transport system substrate-binding protein
MQNYLAASANRRNEESEMHPIRYIVATLVLFALGTSVSLAGEIRVMAAVAVQDPLDRLAAAFTKATGHKVNVSYALTGPILADIKAGKPVDVAVLPDAGRVGLEKAGLSASQTPVSASLAGVGVPNAAPSPDISTLEKFKALLHETPSLSYTDPKSGGAFGQGFDRTLVELGLADEVHRKALMVGGSQEIVKAVASGKAAIAITFKSAIVTTPGLKFAGVLPPPFGNSEPFAASVLKSAASPDIARAFVASLLTPEARTVWTERGFLPAGATAH